MSPESRPRASGRALSATAVSSGLGSSKKMLGRVCGLKPWRSERAGQDPQAGFYLLSVWFSRPPSEA